VEKFAEVWLNRHMTAYKILQQDKNSSARTGELKTFHGTVQTPAFMPIGTCGAVKGITPQMVKDCGAEIILANTYHLFLRPGVENVEKLGGLHKLMAWDGPILTDSGGYQVFSLSQLAKISDEGVDFASHIDGAKIHLDAKTTTNIQNRLGADIIMCFDQCTPYPYEAKLLNEAVERTIRWARVCKENHGNENQLLFGIVQGGIDLNLRQYCAEELVKIDFDGYAIGGLSVGEGHENMAKTVGGTTPLLPVNKPRYLMGAGTPADIVAAVSNGIDMFDCVLPTRNGRNAYAFTENGPVRLRNSGHNGDISPIEAECDCYCCKNFTRGGLRHFFNIGEMLGPILVSIHNIRFYQRLMQEIRGKITDGDFYDWSQEKLKKYIQLFSN
jgi:queuine tRNA-ribosyltransferase